MSIRGAAKGIWNLSPSWQQRRYVIVPMLPFLAPWLMSISSDRKKKWLSCSLLLFLHERKIQAHGNTEQPRWCCRLEWMADKWGFIAFYYAMSIFIRLSELLNTGRSGGGASRSRQRAHGKKQSRSSVIQKSANVALSWWLSSLQLCNNSNAGWEESATVASKKKAT